MPQFKLPRTRRLLASLVALGISTSLIAVESVAPPNGGNAARQETDEVTRANVLAAAGHRDEAIALLTLRMSTHPDDALAKQTLLSLRIAQQEDEIRNILREQSKTKELPVGNPDYEGERSRADATVTKRLDVPEYYAQQHRYTEAVVACNAILKDYPHHPAVLKLKHSVLTELVEQERKELLKYKALRRGDAINDVIDDAIMPGEMPKSKRYIFTFDEDIAEQEREEARKKLLERVDLVYEKGNVREIIKSLFAASGTNHSYLDDTLTDKTLTIHFINETVETALLTISKLLDIRFNYSGGTVFISGKETEVLVTEIIRPHAGLTDVITERKFSGSSGGGNGGGGGGGGGGNRGGGGGGGGGPNLFGGGGSEGGNEEKFVSDLERFLDKVPEIVVGWPAAGKIYFEPKSTSIYVTATTAAIAEVRRLLAALDYNSTQVLIETRFIEVTDAGAKELGVDWAGGGVSGNTFVSAPTTGFTQPNLATNGGATLLNSFGNVAGMPTGSGGFLAQALIEPSDLLKFKATISAMEHKGSADTLSAPKILTLSNAVGIIEVLQDISYISGYSNAGTSTTQNFPNNPNNPNNVINPGFNTSINTIVPEFTTEQAGIEMRIRPSVARNSDVITLTISPSVREMVRGPEPITFANSGGGNGSEPIPNTIERPPQFDTRRLTTALHVKNGGTVVLGGLTKEKDQKSSTGTPFISRIPVIGGLFRRDTNSSERRNLMIFVTAHIIDPEGAKEGRDIQHLRDTARVILPENYDKLPTERQVEANAPKQTDANEGSGPIWRRDRRR